MTIFKTPKEWLAFVTGKKFVRSDNVAIYHFVNPMQTNGFNLKVLWKGKETITNAEFLTTGSPTMRVDDEIFTLKGALVAKQETPPAAKDIIYTVLKGKEVQFVVL